MGGLVLRGHVAEVRWGYARAARCEGYSVTRNGTAWHVSARVVLVDHFNIKQPGLKFAAPYQGGCWVWPIEEITIERDRLTAKLGPIIE